jgi:hypothetical protein
MTGINKTAMVTAIEAAGGEGALVDRIANGETLAAVALSLDCSRGLLSTYLNRDEGRRAILSRARGTSADAMAEETLTLADAATPATERVARLQIEQRRWLASKYLPDTYGEKAPASLTINVNTLHLEALKQLRAERLGLDSPGDARWRGAAREPNECDVRARAVARS